MDNSQCLRTIDSWIGDIKRTHEAVAKMPQQLVPLVKGECDSAIAAGVSLDGEQWAPTVKDGKQPLQGTQKYLDVYSSGSILWIRIREALVFSQFGTHRQKARKILPAKGLPKKLGNAIRFGIVKMGLPFMERKCRHDRSTKGVKWNASAVGKP